MSSNYLTSILTSLVAAKGRKRLTVCKRGTQDLDMEKFDLMKLNIGEVTEKYRGTISNWPAASENLNNIST
jgi:SET domain-containing protein